MDLAWLCRVRPKFITRCTKWAVLCLYNDSLLNKFLHQNYGYNVIETKATRVQVEYKIENWCSSATHIIILDDKEKGYI